MALQILFGADEHTAKDGPYARLMSTRKWIYLSSALAIMFAADLYDQAAAKGLIRVFDLPLAVISPAVLIGLLYLLLQYGLLIGQLAVSYDIIMDERLAFRRAEEIADAQDRVKLAREAALKRRQEQDQALIRAVIEASERVKTAQDELEKLAIEERRLEFEMGNLVDLKLDQTRERLARVRGTLPALEAALASAEVQRSTATLQSRPDDDPDIVEAMKVLDQIRAQNPADRRGYRQAEIAIDWLRLGPPVLVGAGAAARLALSMA